jgi:hypothetical protein
VELPPRFDAQGRPIPGGGGEDEERHGSISDAVEAFMRGRGSRGFASVVDEMLGLRPGQQAAGRGAQRSRDRRRGSESDEYD